MAEESTTPDPVEFVRRLSDESVGGIDAGAVIRYFAPDAVFLTGVGRFEGRDAIRGYVEDPNGSYDERTFASR